MARIRRILAAVKEPSTTGSAAIAKGVELARATGASLELFHAITAAVPAEMLSHGKRRLADIEREIRDRHIVALERPTGRLRSRGLRVSAAAEWDFPPHEAIVRRALRAKADLIVAGQHKGWRTLPWLLHLTDWELLRLSPVPVLLVKSRRAYRRPVVLAALDPGHAFAKSTGLDAEILHMAAVVAEALGGRLHAMHAYSAAPRMPMHVEVVDAGLLDQARRVAEREARASFARELRNTDIPPSRRHLVERDAIDAIPRVARRLRADMVVMGAVSRSGLRRAFIGNTAERVLDRLACDVLVVKPPGFRSSVLRARRGVRFVTSAPPGRY